MLKNIITHKYTNSFILLIYAVCLFVGIINHEMWMDESHHWLVARESNSLVDLIHNYRYDGHPFLWVLIMYATSYISENTLLIQLIHGMITFSGVLLFVQKAPFTSYLKYACAFSYFPLYEYGVITRNYGLLILLLFCLSIYYKNYKQSWIKISIVLGLIANTHIFGLIFSSLFASAIITKTGLSKLHEIKGSKTGILILVVMLLMSLFSILPPFDNPFVSNTGFSISFEKLADALMLFFKALMPVPDIGSSFFWNTNILTYQFKWFIAPLVLLSWLYPFMFRWQSSWLLSVWYVLAITIVVIYLITQLHAGVRYGGVLLLFLITLKWMDSNESTENFVWIPSPFILKYRPLLLGIILIVQIASGVYHTISDIKRPFSATKSIYEFLDNNGYQEYPLVSNAYCNCISIRNYHSQPVYFLNIQDSVIFCEWDQLFKARGLDKQFDLKKSVDETMAYMKKENLRKSVLLYHGEDIFFEATEKEFKLNSATVTPLKTFSEGIVKRENYAVYLIQL